MPDNVGYIAGAIRANTRPVTSGTTVNSNKISVASSGMAKNIEKNTDKINKIVDSQEGSRQEIVKLFSMMNDAQKKTGDASVSAIKELMVQIEKLRLSAGEDGDELIKVLGADKAQKSLGEGESMVGSVWRKYMKTDPGLGIGASILQAFTPEKMFGLEPSSKKKMKTAEAIAEQQVQSEQNLGFAEAAIADTTEAAIADTTEAAIADTSSPLETLTSVLSGDSDSDSAGTFESGTDRDTPAERQVTLLEEIRDTLKNTEENTSGSGGLGTLLMGGLGVLGASLIAVKSAVSAGLAPLVGLGASIIGGIGNKIGQLGSSLAEGLGLKPAGSTPRSTGTNGARPRGDTRVNRRPAGRTSVLSRGLSSLGRFGASAGRVAMGAARVLGPGLLLSSAAAGAVGGFQGFNADPTASLGDRVTNAGSSALNMLSFGAFGSSADEIEQEAELRRQQQIEQGVMSGSVVREPTVSSTEPNALMNPSELEGFTEINPLPVANVTPTGMAISNMNDTVEKSPETIINNVNNVTNNNSSGNNTPPMLVNPSPISNHDMSEFMRLVY